MANRRTWRRYVRHAVGPFDQGVTSIGNFVLSVAIASTSSAEAFGQFALLYSFYWFLTGLCRAIIGESALSETSEERRAHLTSAPLYLALVVGVVGACVAVAVGLIFNTPLLAFGAITFPFLIAQDVSRYIAFGLSRSGVALLSDVVMLALQVSIGLTGTLLLGFVGAESWTISWGVGALVGLIVSIVLLGLGRRPRGTFAWIVHHRRLSSSVGAEFFLNTGSQQLIVFLIPLFAGLSVLGSLKAAQVAVGPLNVLLTSLSLILLPLLFRAFKSGDLKRAQRSYAISVATIGAVALIYGLVLWLLPGSVLSALFGASWAGAMPAALIIVAQTFATGAAQVGSYMLRAAGNAPRSTILRAAVLPAVLVLPILGAVLMGTEGAAWGLLISSAIAAVLWSVTVAVMMRRLNRAVV